LRLIGYFGGPFGAPGGPRVRVFSGSDLLTDFQARTPAELVALYDATLMFGTPADVVAL
jgi:hypothetical protein